MGDQEYSHAIGAMEEVWNKPGSLHDRMKLPFLLAFTNIRDGVHTTILQKFTTMSDAGHTYPPLLFAQDPERQKLFRNVIRKLARAGGYEDEFNAIAGLFSGKSNNELIGKASDFWKTHGEDLTGKLIMGASDPYVLTHMEEDSELKEYFSIVSEELGNSKLHDTELDIGLYTADSANWALMNPARYSNLIEFQS